MRHTEAMTRSASSGVPLGGLAKQLAADTGLDFSGEKEEKLRAALRLAASQSDDPVSTQRDWTTEQLAELLPHLVVGETYFQRDQETLATLQADFLRPLLARRRSEGRYQLRLWSAACCTGEEAYTLLFSLHELLGDELDAWHIDLLATDLNPAFIAHAERGLFGEYAFRQSSPAWRQRYFTPRGKGWQLAPYWRDRVQFKVHNLADAGPPDEWGSFDLILCRNVLMYFTPTAIAQVLAKLVALKTREGRLILTAAEAGLVSAAGWDGEMLGLGYAVTDRRVQAPTAILPPERRRPLPPRPVAPPPVRARKTPPSPHRPAKVTPGREALAEDSPELRQQIEAIRALANSGQMKEAETLCKSMVKASPLYTTPYWLLALYQFESGQLEAALSNLQRLAYLNPDFVLATYLEAQIQVTLGRQAQAGKAKRLCLQMLARQQDDAPIDEGDGLSAGQLRQLCLALRVEQG
ncbi:CheR family methyltransferase [Chitinimonas naiadis]